MNCGKCGKPIGDPNGPEELRQVFQVRVGDLDSSYPPNEPVFMPDEDIGYFCSECLKKGV